MRIHRHRSRKPKVQIPDYNVNDAIKAPEVRVIGVDEVFGVMKTVDALKLAVERELDLVEVSPKGNPPVCKLMEFGQFKYQKEKELRKQRASSKEVDIKGIRLSPRIGQHDFDVRVKKGSAFIERGDKLKIEVVMRGREKAHQDVARAMIGKFVDKLRESYTIKIEAPITKQGGRLTTVVTKE